MSIPSLVSLYNIVTLTGWRPTTSTASNLSSNSSPANGYDTTGTTVDATTYGSAVRNAPSSTGSSTGTLTYSAMACGIATGNLYIRLSTITQYNGDLDYEAISRIYLKYSLDNGSSYTTKQSWSGGTDCTSLQILILENTTLNLQQIKIQLSLYSEKSGTYTASATARTYDIVFVGTLENIARPSVCNNTAQFTTWYLACDTSSSTVDSSTCCSVSSTLGVQKLAIFSAFDTRNNVNGTLYVRVSTSLVDDGDSSGYVCISYSTDSGSNFTNLAEYTYGNDASSANVLSVQLNNINLANLQVKTELWTGSMSIYDIVFIIT